MNEKSLTPLRDEDYEAIEAAVMETARGRWFLTEFAIRNRSADTRVLLDAIQRLENTVRQDRGSGPNGEIDRVRLEIADMASAIERTKEEIAEIQLDTEKGGRFNVATNELDAIVTQTETATQDILTAAETIQELAWTLREHQVETEISDALDKHATDIYTACSFQDLTGQRTRKVVNVLTYLESHIRRMIDIWNAEDGTAGSASPTRPQTADDEPHPDAHLLNGPQLEGHGIDQAAIDDLMSDDFTANDGTAEDATVDDGPNEGEIAEKGFVEAGAVEPAPVENAPVENPPANDAPAADVPVTDGPIITEAHELLHPDPDAGAAALDPDDDTTAIDVFAVDDVELSDEPDLDAGSPATAGDGQATEEAEIEILDMEDDASVFDGLEESLDDRPPASAEAESGTDEFDETKPALTETADGIGLEDGPDFSALEEEAVAEAETALTEEELASADVFAGLGHHEQAEIIDGIAASGTGATTAGATPHESGDLYVPALDDDAIVDASVEPEELDFLDHAAKSKECPSADAAGAAPDLPVGAEEPAAMAELETQAVVDDAGMASAVSQDAGPADLPDMTAIADMLSEHEPETDPTAHLTEAERLALFQ